jgi:hypothetical protein
MLAELYTHWNRLVHAGIFLLGGAICTALVVFRYSNDTTITVHWDRLAIHAVPLWALGVVPLVAGFVLGYLYQLPARLHHLGEFMRHRGRVHELEKELRELRMSLDRVLEMPHDASPMKLATPIEHRALPEPAAPVADDLIAAHETEPDKPAASIASHDSRAMARRRPAKPAPEPAS